MVIRVSIERAEPLRGTAATEDGAPIAFEGWMEFLGVVSELLGLPNNQGREGPGNVAYDIWGSRAPVQE